MITDFTLERYILNILYNAVRKTLDKRYFPERERSFCGVDFETIHFAIKPIG